MVGHSEGSPNARAGCVTQGGGVANCPLIHRGADPALRDRRYGIRLTRHQPLKAKGRRCDLGASCSRRETSQRGLNLGKSAEESVG